MWIQRRPEVSTTRGSSTSVPGASRSSTGWGRRSRGRGSGRIGIDWEASCLGVHLNRWLSRRNDQGGVAACGPRSRTPESALAAVLGGALPWPPRRDERGLVSVLGVVGPCLPEDVFGGLELERRVVDVEVGGQARPEIVEDV